MHTIFCIRPKGFNVGNDAIYIGMQHFIYEAFGEVVNLVSIPATSRYESQAKAGLTAKTIHEINQYGHGVIVGGGNLYENGELDVNIEALKALEVPLMLFSLSRGRIYNRNHELVNRTDVMPDNIIRALNNKACQSLVRDMATFDYLKGIGCENVKLGGCPTIFLDRMVERLPKLSSHDTDTALISIRNPSLMNIPLKKQSHVYGDVTGIIEFLKGKGYKKIKLLCHDHRDIPFAASFPDIDYIYTGDVYVYLSLLKSCSINISYRLHSVLPCLAFRKPAVKISYDERAISIIRTIGFDEWNIDMIKDENIISSIENRYSKMADLKNIYAKTEPVWQNLYSVMSDGFKAFAADVKEIKKKAL